MVFQTGFQRCKGSRAAKVLGTFCFSVFLLPIEFLNKTFKFSEFTSKWVIDGNMDGNMDGNIDGNAPEKTKQKQIKNRSETEQDQNRNRTETEQIQTGQRARLFAQTANVLIMKQKVPFLVLKKALRRAGFFLRAAY